MTQGALPAREFELWSDAGDSSSSRAFDLGETSSFLKRNAIWIVATTLIVTLLCVVGAKLVFNQYVASATVLFDPRNSKVTGAQDVLSDIGPDS